MVAGVFVYVVFENFVANLLNARGYRTKAYLKQHPIIRGLNGSEVVDLVLRYYDDLDDKYQDMIPLKRVYIPVLSEDFSTLERDIDADYLSLQLAFYLAKLVA